MAKSKIDGKALLEGEDPELVAAARTVDPAPGQRLPTLDPEPCEPGTTIGRDLVKPIRVIVGPRGPMLQIVRIEKSELPRGQRDGVKCPGETLYLCTPVGHPEASRGTYEARELYMLDKPEPEPGPEPAPAPAAAKKTRGKAVADKGAPVGE